MFRSLHMKLTLILLLLITSLMAVVGAFLTTSVSNFYIDSFYQQMNNVFGASNADFCLLYTSPVHPGGYPGRGVSRSQDPLSPKQHSLSYLLRRSAYEDRHHHRSILRSWQ